LLQRKCNEIPADGYIDDFSNSHSGFGGNMYVLIKNPGSRIMLKIDTWQSLLQLARDNGWMPQGIESVDYISTDTLPQGSGYTPRKNGLRAQIRSSDANEMGKAIYKAMIRNGLVKPKKEKLRDDGIITDVDELIQVRNFMESGWFVVERVEEYNRKKHPKVLRKFDGSLFQ
jgi:hypothetical protein